MDNSELRFENIFHRNNSSLLELSDGKICTEDGCSFNIHKVILARSSAYFHALYCGDWKERKDALILDIKGDILSNILTYIYTRNLYINERNLCDLLVAADYLLLDELVMDIGRQLSRHLSVNNCLSLFSTAMPMNQSDILSESFKFIRMNFEEIVQSDDSELRELPLEALKELLTDKNLRITDESPIWLAIARWVQAEIFNRQSQVPNLLMHLTIRYVDETLASRILEHNIVSDNPFCKEINEMKSTDSFNSNFTILFRYLLMHPQPSLPMYRLRQPSHLHFIAHYCKENVEHPRTKIYVTYDESLDLWREIAEIHVTPDEFISVSSNIYILKSLNRWNYYYNVIEEEWNEIAAIRWWSKVVKLQGLMCMLGGFYFPDLNVISYELSAYDPERNEWSEVAPMFPVSYQFEAVTFRNYIYVVGRSRQDGMIAQVYDQESDYWLLLPTPVISRYDFALVVYHERIYVLGGTVWEPRRQNTKAVEVFDPLTNEWSREKDLPCAFGSPKAIVLSGNLFVYNKHGPDDHSPYSPVQWNEGLECWISVEHASPLYELHNYHFCTVDDSECIEKITMENRDPSANFLKFSFN